jgi:NAD(P)H-nitrite reductase large subunit
VYRVKLTP